jgi:hypothetical protein
MQEEREKVNGIFWTSTRKKEHRRIKVWCSEQEAEAVIRLKQHCEHQAKSRVAEQRDRPGGLVG